MGRLRPAALAALLALLIRQCQALQEAKPGLLELTTASFAPTLKALPEDRWVLMEFYAHWCGRRHCRCPPRHCCCCMNLPPPCLSSAGFRNTCRCPACQRFQPEYEKLAAFFAQRGEQEPVVTVGRLDCADHVRAATRGHCCCLGVWLTCRHWVLKIDA